MDNVFHTLGDVVNATSEVNCLVEQLRSKELFISKVDAVISDPSEESDDLLDEFFNQALLFAIEKNEEAIMASIKTFCDHAMTSSVRNAEHVLTEMRS